jgi:hypothetical protein
MMMMTTTKMRKVMMMMMMTVKRKKMMEVLTILHLMRKKTLNLVKIKYYCYSLCTAAAPTSPSVGRNRVRALSPFLSTEGRGDRLSLLQSFFTLNLEITM